MQNYNAPKRSGIFYDDTREFHENKSSTKNLSFNGSNLNSKIDTKSTGSYNNIDPPDIYTFPAAQAAAASMPKILENGRKVFGPPANWKGPPPSYICELYLTKVPENLEEVWFIVWLHRFGTVYEFRLMMDSGNLNRGYAFVRYSKLSEALAAFEVLSYHFEGGERMGVYRSQGKNRLYISNIPKLLPVPAIKEGFKKIFPKLQDIMSYESNNVGEQNRGYAFIQFYNHEEALEAKKRTTPGRIRMWNSDLKVQWAKPKHEPSMAAAINNFEGMNGKQNGNINKRFNYDSNEKLRLLCLANDWCIPVVVYGKILSYYGIQYGGILLKCDITGESSYMLMEVSVVGVYDIHLLMSEVAVTLIEREMGFPKNNFLLRVQRHQAEIVTTFSSYSNVDTYRKTEYYFYNIAAISLLAAVMGVLAKHTSQDVLQRYKKGFLAAKKMPFLNFDELQFNILCGILPKFRNNSPLNCNLNDTEINLMLFDFDDAKTYKMYEQKSFNERLRKPVCHGINNNILRLKSQLTNIHNDNYILRYVDVNKGVSFYHPAQQINTHPIWISGRTYQEALYEYKRF